MEVLDDPERPDVTEAVFEDGRPRREEVAGLGRQRLAPEQGERMVGGELAPRARTTPGGQARDQLGTLEGRLARRDRAPRATRRGATS